MIGQENANNVELPAGIVVGAIAAVCTAALSMTLLMRRRAKRAHRVCTWPMDAKLWELNAVVLALSRFHLAGVACFLIHCNHAKITCTVGSC